MKVGIIDVDGKYPNIALMKVGAYYRSRGHHVEHVTIGGYDKIYISKIFDFTPDVDKGLATANHIFKGGTGYDLASRLPKEFEDVDPDYTLYPDCKFSVQFFSRGCIRNCPFCVVRKKEGWIYPVKPMNLNPRGKHIEVLDNNFFANPEWREAVDYLVKINQPVNLHGVDVRTIDEEKARELNKLRHFKQIHIAWDIPEMNLVPKIEQMTRWVKAWKIMCYVLIGFNSTPEQDMYRVEKLRELGVDPFVMAYDKTNHYQRRFARWVNHKAIFGKVKWGDYNG